MVAVLAWAVVIQNEIAKRKAREADREAARIAEEERIVKLIRENPEAYRAVRERQIEEETRRREKAEQQKALAEKGVVIGKMFLDAVMKSRR
jgi:ribonuclease D